MAVASQKLIWPGATGAPLAITVAVSVTTLPDATVVTAFPPDVTDNVVIVGAGAAHIGSSPTLWPKETAAMKHHKGRRRASSSPPLVNAR